MSHIKNISMNFYKTIGAGIKNLINVLSELNYKKNYENYHKGINAYNQRKFDKAIEYFDEVLNKKSISGSMEYDLTKFYYSQAHKNLGLIEFSKGMNEKALEHFNTALEFNPEHKDLNYFIGICLNNMGKFQDAVKAFKKLQAIDPDNVPNRLKIAITFYNLGMWNNAEKIQREILEKNPNYADVHYYLGLSLIAQGKVKESIKSFKRALNINQGYINARLKLGIAQACLKQFDEALKNLEFIIKKHSDYADVYYIMGLIKQELNDMDDSIKYFQKVVKINSNFTKAKLKLIMSLCHVGNTDEAKNLIENFIMLYPDDENIKKVISMKKEIDEITRLSMESDDMTNHCKKIFEQKEFISELYDEFHRNLNIIPSFSEIISLFTNFKYAKHDPDISKIMIPMILEHIHKHPTYPDLYNSLGCQYLLIDKLNEAENAFTKAVELNPEYMNARINLLKTLYKNNKYKDAYEHGQIVLSKNISFPDVYYTIAECLFYMKRYDEALEKAEQTLKIKPSMQNAHILIARIYEAKKN